MKENKLFPANTINSKEKKMLNKFAFCMLIFALSITAAFAQTDQNDDEFENFEVYGGVTLTKDFLIPDNKNMYGVEGAFVKNINRYVGIKADANVSFNSNTYCLISFENVLLEKVTRNGNIIGLN